MNNGTKVIVEAIGKDAAQTLARTYGGTKVWIPLPSKLVDAHPLAQLLGFDLALNLSIVMGGSRLQVPLCQGLKDAMMDEDLVRRWRDGESARAMALAHGTTERTVLRRLARLRASAK